MKSWCHEQNVIYEAEKSWLGSGVGVWVPLSTSSSALRGTPLKSKGTDWETLSWASFSPAVKWAQWSLRFLPAGLVGRVFQRSAGCRAEPHSLALPEPQARKGTAWHSSEPCGCSSLSSPRFLWSLETRPICSYAQQVQGVSGSCHLLVLYLFKPVWLSLSLGPRRKMLSHSGCPPSPTCLLPWDPTPHPYFSHLSLKRIGDSLLKCISGEIKWFIRVRKFR